MTRVKAVSDTSTLSELTQFLFTSFQECEKIQVDQILAKREKILKDEMINFKEAVEKEVQFLQKEVVQVLENDVKVLEKQVKEERGFVSLEKQNLEKLSNSLMELEVKRKEQRDVFEKKGNFKKKMYADKVKKLIENYEEKLKDVSVLKKEGCLRQNMYADELKKVRENYEKELKREQCLMEKKVEDKMRRQFEMFENEREAMQKSLEAELEKLRDDHKKQLEIEILEKWMLEEEVRKSRMEFEEKMKGYLDMVKELKDEQIIMEDILKVELEKSKQTYEELELEHDMIENKLILADLEKMNLVELSKSRIEFEKRLQGFEGENRALHKELELYKESFCRIIDFVEQKKGVYDLAISGNVRANDDLNCSNAGDVSMCRSSEKVSNVDGRLIKSLISSGEPSSKTPSQTERKKGSQGELIGVHFGEKSGCLFLENGQEDGNLGCKRRRIDESKDDKEAAEFETGKETTWSMLSAFSNDPELCMAGVIALYRRHIFSGNPSNILAAVDISNATAVASYLVNGDPTNKISRSLLEVQKDYPYVLQTCRRLAIKYKEQLLEIYQKRVDPLFCSKS